MPEEKPNVQYLFTQLQLFIFLSLLTRGYIRGNLFISMSWSATPRFSFLNVLRKFLSNVFSSIKTATVTPPEAMVKARNEDIWEAHLNWSWDYSPV